MAHELNFFTDGRARLAYVGETPWHGLGQRLTEDADLGTWAKESGLDFTIEGAPVQYKTAAGKTFPFERKQVLYRADTGEALSVVGENYKVVQPGEVLEFFRDLTEDFGFQLETAGALFKGQKYWALARVGDEARIKGQDLLRNYVLLATSCDGSLRTVARQTDVRVVCNNTLSVATAEGGVSEIKVSHASVFKPEKVKEALNLLGDAWKAHVETVKALAEVKVSSKQAVDYVIRLLGDPERAVEEQPNVSNIAKVLQLFDGQGRGAELKSSKGTAWGLVNAVTELNAWHKGRDQQRRVESNLFYVGDKQNTEAFDLATELFVRQAA